MVWFSSHSRYIFLPTSPLAPGPDAPAGGVREFGALMGSIPVYPARPTRPSALYTPTDGSIGWSVRGLLRPQTTINASSGLDLTYLSALSRCDHKRLFLSHMSLLPAAPLTSQETKYITKSGTNTP
ncbi:hypothetical protein THAOC_22317 [Thalassiosira oceanica]|uniref:Uncharacterized protein n=1 Tax=Thalassiosira oceanica TaxID=159749 RepID=K0SGB3_THAOC|nr:hypothetical protein THAOC_22317 [Thalassiosira oceanica]|eukprot:EJK57617.1 hypothetical protein THAOC_22317 [Thalassiosira oceanica]